MHIDFDQACGSKAGGIEIDGAYMRGATGSAVLRWSFSEMKSSISVWGLLNGASEHHKLCR